MIEENVLKGNDILPTVEWTKLLGSDSADYAYALTIGSDGSIYIAGKTSSDLDGQINSGSFDAFISKFNADGTREWTKLLGSDSYDDAYGLTTGSDGSIYIAGRTDGNLDGQTNSGGRDAFISKFNSDGTREWTKLLGSDSYGAELTTGSDGSIYIAGRTKGKLDGQINSYGRIIRNASDAFISKFNPDGTKDWTKLLGSDSYDGANAITTGNDGKAVYSSEGANAITTGNDGSIYIAGYTEGDLDGQTIMVVLLMPL